eukprot:SAG31_NODE_26746_length_437_cov_0.816568_1_plen_47_part_01
MMDRARRYAGMVPPPRAARRRPPAHALNMLAAPRRRPFTTQAYGVSE